MPPPRRYICSFCAKSFSRSEHKSRHERSHTNEKPFSCTICFAKFVRRDLLQRHLRTVHNEQNSVGLIQRATTEGGDHDSKKRSVSSENLAGFGANLPDTTVASSSSSSASSAERPTAAGLDRKSESPSGKSTPNPAQKQGTPNELVSSNIISSNFYSLSERNLILLLALSKKFKNLDIIEGKLVSVDGGGDDSAVDSGVSASASSPVISSSKISNYLLIWGTISNIKFPVILNLNKLLNLSVLNTERSVFSSPLFYSVLAFGAAEFGQFDDCLRLTGRCWELILQKLADPEAIIEPLTILGYISFNYLQELSYFKQPVPHFAVSIHTIFQCLNEVAYSLIDEKRSKSYHGSISMSTINYYKSHGLNVPPELLSKDKSIDVSSELFNYWYTYNLLSSYSLNFGKSPPRIHSLFLAKVLPTNNDYHLMASESQIKSVSKPGKGGVKFNQTIEYVSNETLKDALAHLSTSPSLLKNLIAADRGTTNINSLTNAIFPSNTFKNLTLREYCIIMGLSNELQAVKLGESSLFNSSKNSLHNAIIMANKSLNVNSNYQQYSNSFKASTPVASSSETEYNLYSNSPYSSQPSSSVTYSRNLSTFGSKSHGVHSPNEPNLNIVNNTTINSNSNYLFNVNNFSNMLINNNINQDLINIYNLIIILKKKVLINCDNKLIQDLLIDYIIIPNHELYWNLLYITIKEFTFLNSEFSSWNQLDEDLMHSKFQQSYMARNGLLTPDYQTRLHGSASFSNGAYGIGPYATNTSFNFSFSGFAELIHDIMRDINIEDVVMKIQEFLTGSNGAKPQQIIINNNLGLTSLPLLFIGYLISSLSPQNLMNEGFRNFNFNSPEDLMMNFLNLNAGSMSNNNLIFLKYFLKLPKNFVNLLIENFLILIKIFYSFKKDEAKIEVASDTKSAEHVNKKSRPQSVKPEIEKIISSPILQSIIYVIREMGSNLKNDSFLAHHQVNPDDILTNDNSLNGSKSNVKDSLVHADDDTILYFYLKNIEIIFITWLNFMNFGNNQFIQDNNNVIDNYLTRLIKYIEKAMDGLYKTLNIANKNKINGKSHTDERRMMVSSLINDEK